MVERPRAIANGIYEKELNLDVALRVEKLLKEKGIEVVMTRRDDSRPSLSGRVNTAVNSNADAFVSIHGNSYGSIASGTETWYSTASTEQMIVNNWQLLFRIEYIMH